MEILEQDRNCLAEIRKLQETDEQVEDCALSRTIGADDYLQMGCPGDSVKDTSRRAYASLPGYLYDTFLLASMASASGCSTNVHLGDV